MEPVPQLILLLFGLPVLPGGEGLLQLHDRLPLPLVHQVRMKLIVAGSLVDRPLAVDRFQCDPGLELISRSRSLPLFHFAP